MRTATLRGVKERNLSLPIQEKERQQKPAGLLLLASGLFGGDGLALFLSGAADLGLLLTGFLLIRLRGFVTHSIFFLRIDSPPA